MPAHTDMEAFPSLFTSGALGDRRSVDLRLAWLDAADDAHEAYIDWRDAERAAEADAFVVYRSRDRNLTEGSCRCTLQLHMRGRGGGR